MLYGTQTMKIPFSKETPICIVFKVFTCFFSYDLIYITPSNTVFDVLNVLYNRIRSMRNESEILNQRTCMLYGTMKIPF